MRVAEVREGGRLEVAFARLAPERQGLPVTLDGLGIPVQLVVRVPETVPRVCLPVAVTGLLL